MGDLFDFTDAEIALPRQASAVTDVDECEHAGHRAQTPAPKKTRSTACYVLLTRTRDDTFCGKQLRRTCVDWKAPARRLYSAFLSLLTANRKQSRR